MHVVARSAPRNQPWTSSDCNVSVARQPMRKCCRQEPAPATSLQQTRLPRACTPLRLRAAFAPTNTRLPLSIQPPYDAPGGSLSTKRAPPHLQRLAEPPSFYMKMLPSCLKTCCYRGLQRRPIALRTLGLASPVALAHSWHSSLCKACRPGGTLSGSSFCKLLYFQDQAFLAP